MTDKEYKYILRQFHKASDRHVLVVETDLSEPDVLRVFAASDRLRKAGNELVAIMRRNYHQLIRTKRYRKLRSLYGKTKNDTLKRDYLKKQLEDMQAAYNVTWESCRKAMIPIAKKYNVNSVFGLTKAEDIWNGIAKCLYGDGKNIHFSRFGEYPGLRAKQINHAISVFTKGRILHIRMDRKTICLKVKDRFQQDELNAVVSYLQNPEKEDMHAIRHFLDTGECISTYRPCFATLIPRKIRGRYRVFLHLCIEGKALPKYDRHGNPRHCYGRGRIGADIGTQTVAYTSETSVGLKNLAERGKSSISHSERMERIYLRRVERSRRAMNPQNYNEDGTIKKGRKTWRYSKNYNRTKYLHANLCRKNAINRRLAINEDVNRLRSIGDVFVTEPKNASKLMRRAKKTTVNEKTGRINRKKRFGKSIRNRCPGYFQARVQKVFEATGGLFVEAPYNYRASQYDHTADDYIKKKLSQRIFKLTDGTEVQRDWYSSFLLYCYSFETSDINRSKCVEEFSKHLIREKALIAEIKAKKIKVLNSGIKIAA